jgi:hypothetical protein
MAVRGKPAAGFLLKCVGIFFFYFIEIEVPGVGSGPPSTSGLCTEVAAKKQLAR